MKDVEKGGTKEEDIAQTGMKGMKLHITRAQSTCSLKKRTFGSGIITITAPPTHLADRKGKVRRCHGHGGVSGTGFSLLLSQEILRSLLPCGYPALPLGCGLKDFKVFVQVLIEL